jgi:hypothetical protein
MSILHGEIGAMRVFRIAACAFIMMGTLTAYSGTETMDDESHRARVGQGSRGGGITFAPTVDIAFERAQAKAKADMSPTLTTERLLIELLEEETALPILTSANVDVDALRADLKATLSSDTPTAAPGDEPRAVESLQNAMRRAVITAVASNARGATGADLLTAILVEGDTHAAEQLRKYGLDIQTVENSKLELYLRRNKEQTKFLAEMQQRARTQREGTQGVVAKRGETAALGVLSQAEAGGDKERHKASSAHKPYVLRISSDDVEHAHVLFKAAVSRNGILDLYIEQTPFEIQFVAHTVVGLFEAVEGGDRLRVQLITELEGEERSVSGFGGSSGAIFNETRNLLGQRSGVLD